MGQRAAMLDGRDGPHHVMLEDQRAEASLGSYFGWGVSPSSGCVQPRGNADGSVAVRYRWILPVRDQPGSLLPLRALCGRRWLGLWSRRSVFAFRTISVSTGDEASIIHPGPRPVARVVEWQTRRFQVPVP